MLTYDQVSGEKAGMKKDDRADLETLLALAASEVARKRVKVETGDASQMHLAAS